MLADAEAAGCKLSLSVGYRSVERQTALFKRKTNSFMAGGLQPGGGRKTGCHVGGAPRHLGA